jgi:site-specific recombinase XerD
MTYPDGGPNLRPGAERLPVSGAPRYSTTLLLDELFEDFLAASASIINDRTDKGYRYDWGYFVAWLLEVGLGPVLGSLSNQVFVSYIAHQQRRPKQRGAGTLSSHSVHTYTRVVRTFVRWLVAEGYYPNDPFAGGQRGIMPRLGPHLLKMAGPDDVEVLLRGCEGGRTALERALRGRDATMILLATDTSHRTSDVTRSNVMDIDLADAWALVRHGKWDRERRAPLSRETVSAIRTYLRRDRPVISGIRPEEMTAGAPLFPSARGDRLTPSGLYQAMSRAYKRGGGTSRFGLHRLRHYFGTTAASENMHPRISQQIMGHADEKSQRVYQHPSDAVVKAEHARVTPIRALRPARRRRLA